MRTSVLSAALLSFLSLPLAGQGLTRVAPAPGEPSLPDAFAREFRREEWRAALEQPDLERRQEAYEALLTRARFDPLVRAFVEELAADPAAGELGWTARLALRELGRARFLPASPLLGPEALLRGGGLDPRLQEMLEGLQAQRLRAPGARGLAAAGGRSVRVQQDQDGAKVEIVSEVDGEEQRRSFEGTSLEEILAAHPELERELGGFSLRLPPGQSIDLGLGLPQSARSGLGARAEGRTFATPLGSAEKSNVPLLTDKLGVIVQPLTAEHAHELGLVSGLGLYVERSQPGSFADLLGITTGDVLLELDGTPLQKAEDIEAAMKARRRDADLALTWIDASGQRQAKTWKKR